MQLTVLPTSSVPVLHYFFILWRTQVRSALLETLYNKPTVVVFQAAWEMWWVIRIEILCKIFQKFYYICILSDSLRFLFLFVMRRCSKQTWKTRHPNTSESHMMSQSCVGFAMDPPSCSWHQWPWTVSSARGEQIQELKWRHTKSWEPLVICVEMQSSWCTWDERANKWPQLVKECRNQIWSLQIKEGKWDTCIHSLR